MPSMGHNWKSGLLGSTSPTLVKNQGRISILSQEGPTGTQYRVLIDYGDITEEQLFPTTTRKAQDGSQHHTLSPEEAFSQFEALVAMYEGVATDASGIDPQKVGSHEELDTMLLSMPELPLDITIEIQRRGTHANGRPKTVLDLKYETGLVSRILGPRTDSLRLARIHYESYSKEQRIAALRDLRDRVAARYLTAELLSSMLMSDRVKREAYRAQILADPYSTVDLTEYMETTPTVAANPLIAFRVRFVDQHGNEISGLPYEVSVRGVLNFEEALKLTNAGANPGNFSSGRTLTEQGMSDMGQADTTNGAEVSEWYGRSLSPNHEYHLLYPYRVRSKGGTPRGTVKISVTTPRNTTSTADWGNNRLFVYEQVSNASEKRDANTIQAAPKMMLYSHNYKLTEGESPQNMTITVPVYVEPLPMHLVESPKGSGNIVSVWSVTDDIGAIPNHQKTQVTFTVLRPKASDKWEQADEILPDTRTGYMDKFLQYNEFTSPEGRAAYREAEKEASPVRGIRFVLFPDKNNTWQAAKQPIYMQPDGFGVMNAEVCPGKYLLKMLIEINADGTTGLRIITSSKDPEYEYGVRYDKLAPEIQDAVINKYPDRDIKRWTRFAPETIQLGVLESPAAFYYRKTTEEDTTPVGAVGVKLLKSGNIQDTGSSRFRKFELKTKVPALLAGKEPELGSIYEVLGVQYPAIDGGWPGQTTDTDERIFDNVTLLLSPDSSIDLSMLSAYEQRYEAERESGGQTTGTSKVPAVGTRIAYMGYWIEHAWFDSAVGPELINKEGAFTGGIHQYNMGKLETPFYDEGVLRLMCFYPQAGVMRRKMVKQAQQTTNPNLVVASVESYPKYNPQQAAMDRVFHFQVEAGPEGAILSGRWCPLEIIGFGNLDDLRPGFTDEVFEAIKESIRKGGGPLSASQFGESGSMPKWNMFWSTTHDGWLFGGNDGMLPNAGDDVEVSTDGYGASIDPSDGTVTVSDSAGQTTTTAETLGTTVSFMNEHGNIDDLIHAPQPTYNDDEDNDFGFIGGDF